MKKISIFVILTLVLAGLIAAGVWWFKPPQPADKDRQSPRPAAGKEQSLPTVSSTDFASLSSDICLNNTNGEAQAKDCCDCLPGVTAETRKTCRDAVVQHNFSQNSGLIELTAPSTLGPQGDYTSFTSAESQQACKQLCDSSTTLVCGDGRFCRDACAKLPEK